MTDLLQRMVQRTLRPSSAVQPLPVSRYEPAGITGSGLQIVKDAQAIAYSGLSEVQQNSFPEIYLEAKRSTAVTDLSSVPVVLSPAEKTRDSSSVLLQKPAKELTPNFVAEQPNEKPELSNQFQPPAFDVHVVPSDVSSQEETFSPMLFLAQRRREQPRPNTAAARTIVQTAQKPVPEFQTPEINISIGHIEVRAARRPEAPSRPAFRPQLSLEDFLNSKKNGARS